VLGLEVALIAAKLEGTNLTSLTNLLEIFALLFLELWIYTLYHRCSLHSYTLYAQILMGLNICNLTTMAVKE
jgi:hypothetical protein